MNPGELLILGLEISTICFTFALTILFMLRPDDPFGKGLVAVFAARLIVDIVRAMSDLSSIGDPNEVTPYFVYTSLWRPVLIIGLPCVAKAYLLYKIRPKRNGRAA